MTSTSSLAQRAAASFEDGASARFAVSANSTRSALGSSRRPFSRARIAGPMPSRSHSASSTCVPPSGRDSANCSPSAGRALPGSRCRETDATSRSSASRVPGSSRPKFYTTCTRDRFAAGSHTL